MPENESSDLPVTAPNNANSPRPSVNPASLSIQEVARLLSAAGGRMVTPQQIQADIDAGAPAFPGDRVNLVHYAAWLLREVQAR